MKKTFSIRYLLPQISTIPEKEKLFLLEALGDYVEMAERQRFETINQFKAKKKESLNIWIDEEEVQLDSKTKDYVLKATNLASISFSPLNN